MTVLWGKGNSDTSSCFICTCALFELAYGDLLLRYTSCAPLKYTVQHFLVYSESCPISPLSNCRLCSSVQKTSCTLPLSVSSTIPRPSPQPQATISLLSASLDLPVLNISYKWNHTIRGLLFWLLSLSKMLSRLIHVVVRCNTSLLLPAESYSTTWIHYIFFLIFYQLMEI